MEDMEKLITFWVDRFTAIKRVSKQRLGYKILITFCIAIAVNLSMQNVITFSYVFQGRMVMVYVDIFVT